MDFDFDNVARIYVGDLSEDATEHGLREHFGRYGDVLRVLLCRAEQYPGTRSYAYIWFSNATSADMSLQENNPVVLGRPVRVLRPPEVGQHGIIHDDPDIGDGYELEETKIVVNHLPENLTIEELVDHFLQFGAITDATITWPTRLGYVTYSTRESAENAVTTVSHTLGGMELEVRMAQLENEGNPEGPRRGGRRIGGNTWRDLNHSRVNISQNILLHSGVNISQNILLPRFLTQNFYNRHPLPRYGMGENPGNGFQPPPPPPPFPEATVVGSYSGGNNSNESSGFGGGELPDGNGGNEGQGFQDPRHHDEAPAFGDPNEGQEPQAPPSDVAPAFASHFDGNNNDDID